MDDDDEQGQGRRIKVAESAASSSRAPPKAAEGGSAANGSSVMVDSGRANGAVDNAAVTAIDGGRSAADGAADAADGGTQHGLLPSRPTGDLNDLSLLHPELHSQYVLEGAHNG
jgi:hypothetical protein